MVRGESARRRRRGAMKRCMVFLLLAFERWIRLQICVGGPRRVDVLFVGDKKTDGR